MSEYIHNSHNVSILLYHFVYPAKYRRVVFDEYVDKASIVKITAPSNVKKSSSLKQNPV